MINTVVITGATSGIGKALAKYFAKSCRVFAAYRNEDYVSELESIGTIPFYIDMTDSDSIRRAAVFIKSETQKVDVLINVAGCVVAGAVETLDIDRLRGQFEVNTFAHLDFTQKLLDLLDGGRIINISSMASYGIFPFVAPYCASKRALDILFNAFATETKRDIKVISIKPGVIATPLWEKSVKINQSAIENCEGYEKEMDFMVKNALKNGKDGLPVSSVVKLIAHAAYTKNPKSSYTIGLDAKFARFASILPQDWLNKLIKIGISKRIGK